jgi:hypothetical protein
MDKYSFLNAAHTAYFADLYEQYQQDPESRAGKRSFKAMTLEVKVLKFRTILSKVLKLKFRNMFKKNFKS